MDSIVTFQILHRLEEVWKLSGTKGQDACEALHVQWTASACRSISDYSTQLLTEQIVPSEIKTKPIRWRYDCALAIVVPVLRDLRRTWLDESNSASQVLAEAAASMVLDFARQIITKSVDMKFPHPI